MRIRIRLGRILFWGAFLFLACLGGAIGFACWYATDSETLAGLIKAEVPRYFPGSALILERVRVRPFVGEINLVRAQLIQGIDGAPFKSVKLPWVRINLDPRAMLKRRFAPREVMVGQPTLRLRRRRDGTWNLQGLLADPWPGPMLKTPPIVIRNGTVELVDGDGPNNSTAILRDVAVQIEPGEGKVLKFEGQAKGDLFDGLSLKGTVDLATGQVILQEGDLARLVVSETFRSRLPAEVRQLVDQAGLTSGEIDLRARSVVYDPESSPPIRYDLAARLRSGVWDCPRLPFPINDLSATVTVQDGVVEVQRAEGFNGPTTVRVERGQLELGDPERAPLDLQFVVFNLELDKRLHRWTPPEFAKFWTDFSPSGRISARMNLLREQWDGPLGYAWSVNCRDVAMNFRFFPYPLDHIQGTLTCAKNQIRLERLQTLVGGKPLVAWGTIDNPGDDADVKLHFQGDGVPIDQTLFDALPPAIRQNVAQFHPTGSVRGRAEVHRTKRIRPTDPPEGNVAISAFLELNKHCAILWDGMPYPVSNLTGKLELHPNRWIFTDMRGSNGQAVITGSGSVEKLPGKNHDGTDRLAIDLRLAASMLPFNNQLRDALQPAWQKSWATLNPVGSSNVDATIRIRPGQPDHTVLVISPERETSVRLEFGRPPTPGAGDPGGQFDLRMEDVRGRFIFDNGPVVMERVGFQFYGSPVEFARGRLVVKDTGQFKLNVEEVEARHFRLDQEELRRIMPPVMAQFARRLDDGRPIPTIKGNLGLEWSGKKGDPVHCDWNKALVIFNDNAIQAGLPLEHLQGQLDSVRGRFDGQNLNVVGALRLYSVSLLGQQVTELESPFRVGEGLAQLTDIRGKLLGGQVTGRFEVSLDATPRYAAALAVAGADLQRYARTLGGHQGFRGLVSGKLELNGLGNDIRTLQGTGEAQVRQGDLGQLPLLLQMVKRLNIIDPTKAAFDSADIGLTIRNGESFLDPIRLTGNTISLLGRGKMDVQGVLNLSFQPVPGRDRFRLPFLSDVLVKAGSELFTIRVHGPIASPTIGPLPVPRVADGVQSIGKRRRAEREL